MPSEDRTDIHVRQFVAARVVRVRQSKGFCLMKVYNGSLVHPLVIGMPLVLVIEDRRQLVTTLVAEIREAEGAMRVKTRNSEYRVEFMLEEVR